MGNTNFYLVTFFLVIYCTITLAKTSESVCKIPIGSKRHYRYQWPLVFKPNGELYNTILNVDEERQVHVENGAEVLLSCGPNYLKNFNRKEVLNVRCNGASGNFTLTNALDKPATPTEMNIKEFACDLRVIEEVLTSVDGCSNTQWTATRFGYVEPTEKVTYILGEACYDMVEGRTIFAHVKLGNSGSNYLQRTADKAYLTSHQHPDGRYKIELFRELHFDEIYERIRSQLHSKHAPPLKMSNFIEETLLSNGQFQAVKKLGWNYFVAHEELEVLETLTHDIKQLQLSTGLSLDVYVGSHGVAVLHGNGGEQMEVYMHEDGKKRFPMPKLIWIVVRQQQRGIAFGIYNDEANTVNQVERSSSGICRSDCEKVTWLLQTLKISVNRKGLLCCEYEEFRKQVEEVPEVAYFNEMLYS